MKSFTRLALLCCAAALAGGRILAADNQPVIGVSGKVLFEDDFSRADLKPKWKPGLGFWAIHDGVLAVEENPENHHGAYAYATPGFGYKDMVAEFAFKLDGSKSCDLKMEDSNYKGSHAGHIIRASITPAQVSLGDSKNGSMEIGYYARYNDPKATPEEKKALAATIKNTSASFKNALDVTQWHQARVEVVGDEMVISIDGRLVGYLKAPGVDHPTKNLIGFTCLGKTTLIDNVKICEATAAPGWPAKRSEVLTSLGLKP